MQASGSRIKLLVVDDEPDNLDLIYRTFRREFDIFRAKSGLDALQILTQAGEMGIVISDQRMPKMSGTEFLSIVADRFPDTIRILLTGYADVDELVGAINSSKVFKFVTKPWNPGEFRAIVQQAADAYRLLKQRTNELHRSLRRESLFNAVTTAIRESLDYHNMLQIIVETIGQTFAADSCLLYPISKDEDFSSSERFWKQAIAYSFYSQTSTNCYPVTPSNLLPEWFESNQIQQNLIEHDGQQCHQLQVPLMYQKHLQAIMLLYRCPPAVNWLEEELSLLSEVAEQAALAISQARLYQQIQQQTEQMRAELAVARQVQTKLLRQNLPQLEQVKIQACCYPAREVGGDFFEAYVHPQGNIWLAIGDVSGKGVPAALFMASTISVLRRELTQASPPDPNVIMQNLNQTLSEDLVSNNCFITMVLACYNSATQELSYANAGHVYPLVWSQTVRHRNALSPPPIQPNYLKVRGVPLGILPHWQAPTGRLILNTGDILLLITDGIIEATVSQSSQADSSRSSMLNESGLWQLLMQESAALNLERLLARVREFNLVQEDDQTILSLEVL
jgi:serine phosphatase RsbU (regulator of sigma subunit)/CheY-like chemotaxis protein